ncbi:alpha/beta hydrolase [Candidatus Halobonum tyrrellensis]|uniref:Esterase/lipase n=1 Tax=Candidatus Halobonum tyrrellensis G22 TaxID=1324957 RepID=V4HGF0_9EURY|nr:alpha/beta hydrolase [Candidatus Halobonum tyrrellensis]ESP89193.1 esterase/lipase [Candidatus Halobonum tyrrellensis G22]
MAPTDLDSDLAAVVTDIEALGVPGWGALSVESGRRVEADLFGDGGESGGGSDAAAADADSGGRGADPVSTVDLSFDGSGGPVPVRVYRPPETPAPTLVFFHGGGWCLGTLDSADDIARGLCERVGAVVVSVDYRLAPEHPFPAAVDDAADAVAWVREHAAALGGDGRVGVAGTSAGGNLAAATALRESGEDDLSVQALLYPVTDRDFTTDSYAANADGPLLTRGDMEVFWDRYLRSDVDAANPYAAPLRASEAALGGTAEAVVVTAGHDPLRDDGARYATRLDEAGVGTTHLDYPSMCHGFLSFGDAVPAADAAFDEAAAAIRSAFDG